MSNWIKCSEQLPEMLDEERTVDVVFWFGDHAESGCFYFDEAGDPYHVFFDGDSLSYEPIYWMPLEPPK